MNSESEILTPRLRLRRAQAGDLEALNAIMADVDPRNTASLTLLSRLGFQETSRAARTWLIGEEWCDSVYLSLAKPEIDPSYLQDYPSCLPSPKT